MEVYVCVCTWNSKLWAKLLEKQAVENSFHLLNSKFRSYGYRILISVI